MDNIDYLYASDGTGEAVRAVVTGTRTIASTTLEVDSLNNWPAYYVATVGTLDEDTGILDPATITVFKGHTSGGDIIIDEIAPGYSDAGNSVGQVVILKPNTFWADTWADIFKVGHNTDGSLKIADDKPLTDENGNELIKADATASAVNEITVKNAATGNPPEIQATGGDTNTDLKLVPKGTGVVKLDNVHHQADTTNSQQDGVYYQCGWGQIQGNATASIGETLTFPKEFTSVLAIVVIFIGFKETSAATAITQFDNASGVDASTEDLTTSSVKVWLNQVNAASLGSGRYWGYSWIAIGT